MDGSVTVCSGRGPAGRASLHGLPLRVVFCPPPN